MVTRNRWMPLALPALLLWAAPVSAHLLNMTRVQIDVAADGAVEAQVSIDLTREAGGPGEYYQLSHRQPALNDAVLQPLLTRLASAMQLTADNTTVSLTPITASLPQRPEADFHDPGTWPMSELHLQGRIPAAALASGHLQMQFSPAFRFEEPIALTLRRTADGRSLTRWLVAGQLSPRLALGEAPLSPASTEEAREGWDSVWRYLRYGLEHILPRGLDHVLFVLGLYLGTRSLRSLLLLITSFTAAHTLTLILSSLGAVRLPASVVEPAIAASICWIGIENLWFARMRGWRPVLVFLFGLLHGLGFAAALAELGLPREHFVAALLAFNVGVEGGQLTVIALALLATGWLRQRESYRRHVAVPGSLVIALIAAAWTVHRIMA